MAKNYWLVKQEPGTYSWTSFVEEVGTAWTGVRNFQARNNLRAMKKGDFVFFYHSGDEKQIVGLAGVEKEFYPDPTATEGDWSAVDLVPVKMLRKPLSLGAVKADRILRISASSTPADSPSLNNLAFQHTARLPRRIFRVP